MNQPVENPSFTSPFSSSVDDSSLSEQRSEVSGNGKPSVRLKRRHTVQPAPRSGKKRPRTLSSPFAPPAGRKRGRGKCLPLTPPHHPASLNSLISNGELAGDGQEGDAEDDSVQTSSVVVFRNSNEFLQLQDICVSCGAIGVEDEGKLIGCAQCGQCYHSFCAGVKLSSAVLTSGWRCLDCTLCEVCGKPHDEGRLILCDECDISFHIYCLDPPLEQVPLGNWKCRRCVRCQYCDSASPGYGPSAQWHNNYSTCTPCASLQKCPVCESDYADRELVIQCLQCDRFLHASCDAIMDEDDVESAFSMGYICPFCRPENHPPLHLQHVFEDEESNECEPDVSEPKPAIMHKYDGMLLSDAGLKHIKRLNMDSLKPKSPKKKCGKLYEPSSDLTAVNCNGLFSHELDKMDESSLDDKRKRSRRPQRFGIGGFLLRGPKPRAEKDREFVDLPGENFVESQGPSGTMSPAESLDNHLTELAGLDPTKHPNAQKTKKKKPQPKKRFLVKDMFPDYLQDAFFGKSVLDTVDSGDTQSPCEELSLKINIEDSVNARLNGIKTEPDTREPPIEKKHIKTEGTETWKKLGKNTDSQTGEEDVDFPDLTEGLDAFLNQDPLDGDLGMLDLGMLMAATEQEEDSSSQDDEPVPAEPRAVKEPEAETAADNLDCILDSLESDLPQMSSEDAEDVFNDVFVDSQTVVTMSGNSMASSVIVRMGSTASVERGGPEWPGATTDSGDSMENANSNFRILQKAEQDEALGPLATVSSVLYANMQHPDLKQKHPEFPERYKQILRIWRKVSTNDRQPFLQKARENRVTNKATKIQRPKEEQLAEQLAATAPPVKLNERSPTVFGGQDHGLVSRFVPAEPLEPSYYNVQDEMSCANPSTPSSQPSTPGSSASHVHHQQSFHIGSPAPPFSPLLERPGSVLPMQHHTNEPAYGVQSPHSYQQVQSPRTPFPPSSPFDPYVHPPASVQSVVIRQHSQDHPIHEEQDSYSHPPGTPMPERFQQQFSHAVEPQSPQNSGQPFPRQQLRDLLNRQNQTRQGQQMPGTTWHYPHLQSQNGAFPSPQQVYEQSTIRMSMQNIPVQRQEFRHPAPPYTRMVQPTIRCFQASPQQNFNMHVRGPNQNAMLRSNTIQNAQYGKGQQLGYDQPPTRYSGSQWHPQQSQDAVSFSGHNSHEGAYGGVDSRIISNQNIQADSSNRQFVGEMRLQTLQPTAFGSRSPSAVQSPVQPRQPVHWSQQLQTQSYSAMPARPPSVLPSTFSAPAGIQQMSINGVTSSRPMERRPMSESERHSAMTQESWLLEHYHRLTSELGGLQQDIAKARKQRKALAARQRQMRKSNHDLSPEDCMELDRLTNAVSAIQKRLDTVKKDYKQHQNEMQEFTAKTGMQLIVSESQVIFPGAPITSAAQPMHHGPAVHAVRPGLSQFNAPNVHPGHVSPYSPTMMSPKREDQFVNMLQSSPPFTDSGYPGAQFSPPVRPPQLRFSQPVPNNLNAANHFPHPNVSQQGTELARNQFVPDMQTASPQLSPTQHPDGHTSSGAMLPMNNTYPQLSGSVGLMKMDPLPPNASIRTMVPGIEVTSRSGTDGRSIYNIKRPSTDEIQQVAGFGVSSDAEDKSSESKNILLKQLLEHGSVATPAVVPERKVSLVSKSLTDDDEQAAALTPAQQQQLAMIESMPLTTRKESLSSSPVQSISLASDTMNTITSETGYDLEDVKKKKSPKKRKKKLALEDSGDSYLFTTSAESVTSVLLEQLRPFSANLLEPDKSSFPPSSISSKPETDSAPIPVGKKLDDLKKSPARRAQGSFGQYELLKQGNRSRFYVGISRICDETVMLPAKVTSGTLYEEDIQLQNYETPDGTKTENCTVKAIGKAPASPAISYISTSSYGESRLLEPCYDHLYDWLEISFPPDGPSCTDIDISQPTIAAHYDPGSPASFKENRSNDIVKYELVSPDRSGKLLKDSDRVNVTMTISDEAASNMEYFLQGLADLLRIPVNEIEMISSECGSDVSPSKADIKSFKYCRTCEIVLSQETGFRKRLSEFPLTSLVDNGFPVEMDDGVAYLSFCSSGCMLQFAINNQTGTNASPPATVSLDHGVDIGPKMELKKEKREPSPPKRLTSVQLMLKSIAPLLRKGKKARHELWTPSLLQVKRQNRVLDSLTSEQILNLLDVGLKVRSEVRDTRVCVLCHLIGDFLTDGPGRLLNIDGDQWVHLNCALWSTEVYETINGHLMNVQPACKRGAKTECLKCRKYGATLVCYKYPTKVRCNQVLHFPCAKNSGCMFFNDKSVLCEIHKPGESPEDELKTMAVHRRVYVHRDESRLASRVIGARDGMYTFRVGTLIFHSLGQLLHASVDAFHNKDCVYPVGYSVTRIFWSMRALHKRCFYHCTILELDGIPDFRITVEERGYDNILLSGSTSKEVWMKVLTAVLEHRSSTMIKVFPDFFSGDDLFGLTESNIAKAIECLPGINEAIRYQFKFEKPRLPESPVVASAVHNHQSGSARTEPKLKLMSKRSHSDVERTKISQSISEANLAIIPPSAPTSV